MATITELQVNGLARQIHADAERTLLSVLRDDLDLTGSKYGCGEGRCGACTVLVNGLPAHACRMPIKTAAGKKVATIESLAQDGRLHPLQEAFLEVGAMQCGYCTPGMIMAGLGLLQKNPDPSEEDVRNALDGNLCRCGTYNRIIAAVRKAARKMKEGRS